MTLRPAGAWQRTPLWLRLVSALLVLAAVGVTLTAGFGARLLRGYLVERVDDQLREAAGVYVGFVRDPQASDIRVLTEYRFALQDANGQVITGLPLSNLGPDQAGPRLPAMTPDEAEAQQHEALTVSAQTGHSSWRVLAVPVSYLDAPATLFVGASLDDVDATVARLLRIDLIVGLLVLGGLALIGYTMVRTAMRPLTAIERTAGAIAEGDLSRRIADQDPGTEVGRLGRALNRMLEQIEAAFRARETSESTARRSEDRMRRFVADASHELRTPLTSIRGFAELHRQGAVTDPEAVSHLLHRIEDEATRMGLLVDDLLLLARLDQQRPLERGPVDLVVVAADAVEAVRARAPDRSVRLTVEADDGVVVSGDEGRLRQVVTNLVDNARVHTPAGTPITVRVARRAANGVGDGTEDQGDDRSDAPAGEAPDDGPGADAAAGADGEAPDDAAPDGDGGHGAEAVVEVVDQGHGLEADQAERVFERFYRVDAARSRAQGGTGLGLSIVAAIVAAHGGSVEVDTAPGLGATFRVRLPLE